MRWEDLPESQNVEDRRGESGGGGGGGGGFPGGAGGLGIGTILVLGLIGYATGIDPSLLIGMADQFSRQQPQVQTQPTSKPGAAPTDEVLLKLLQRKTMLETEVAELKIRKTFLSATEYAKEFERIMIELAQVSHDIRTRTKS